jgi:atypical dual specificity phosphatase
MGTGGYTLRRLRSRFSNQPTGFTWIERGKLSASGYPASRAQVAWLRRKGIGSILTLTEQALPEEWLSGLDMKSGHVAMIDHQPPSIEQLEAAVDFVETRLAEGSAVNVHCLAGKGRTMCVVAAHLMKAEGITSSEAITRLRSIRYGAVEQSQESSLREYERVLKGEPGQNP